MLSNLWSPSRTSQRSFMGVCSRSSSQYSLSPTAVGAKGFLVKVFVGSSGTDRRTLGGKNGGLPKGLKGGGPFGSYGSNGGPFGGFGGGTPKGRFGGWLKSGIGGGTPMGFHGGRPKGTRGGPRGGISSGQPGRLGGGTSGGLGVGNVFGWRCFDLVGGNLVGFGQSGQGKRVFG